MFYHLKHSISIKFVAKRQINYNKPWRTRHDLINLLPNFFANLVCCPILTNPTCHMAAFIQRYTDRKAAMSYHRHKARISY